LHLHSTGGFGVEGSRPPPKLPGNDEGEKSERNSWNRFVVCSRILPLARPGARRAEKAVIKVPFAFVIGSKQLPAGAYQIEMLTQSTTEQDAVEVIAIRRKDTRS
jgi:hypothetical protein